MLRTAKKAAVLLFLFFLANQAQGWSFHTDGLSDVAEDNHDEQNDQYFDSEDDDNEVHEEEEDHHDYDDLFYLEEDAADDQSPRKATQRALRHRSRPRNSEELHGSRNLRSKGRAGSRSYSRSFLDPDIEPRPFINCIPLPPGRSGSSKGKGGKGKGNRRRSRKYRSKSRRKLETGSRNLRDMDNSGRNLHRGRGRGRSSHSSLSSRSYGGRMGMGGGGGRGRRKKLPYCPLPTFEPTFVPTITPFPTFTPLPTITPFPSFTPFPTEEDAARNPSKSPTTAPSVSSRPSAMPTLSNMPTRSNQPSLSNQPSSLNGPTTRTTSGRLEYGFFTVTTIREPTAVEWAGLYAQTNSFYSDVLRQLYPTTFTSFALKNQQTFYNGALPMPAYFDWDADVVFNTGDAATPSNAQLFLTLSNADYMSYITSYVWNSEPLVTSIFYNTEMVSFRAKGG